MDIVEKLLSVLVDEFNMTMFLIDTAWEDDHFFEDDDDERAAHEIYESEIRHNAENRHQIAQYLLNCAKSDGFTGDMILDYLRDDLGDRGVDMDKSSDSEVLREIESIIAPRVWVRGKGYVMEE